MEVEFICFFSYGKKLLTLQLTVMLFLSCKSFDSVKSFMKKIKNNFKELKTNLKMSWYFVREEKLYFIILVILSLMLAGLSFIIPMLSAQLLLKLTDGLLKDLMLVAIIIFFIEILRNVILYFFRKIFELYSIKATTNAQIKMFEETLKIKTAVIEDNTTGMFIDRINNDTEDIINTFSNLCSVFINMISNAGVFLAVFVINKYMFIYFVLSFIVIAVIENKRNNIYYERTKKLRLIDEKKTGLISEIVRGLQDIKLLNAQSGILKRTRRQLKDINDERIGIVKVTSNFQFISGSVSDLFDVIFYALGCLLVYLNSLTIANFVIIYTYKSRIENLLSFYNSFSMHVRNFNLSATRVFEVIGNTFDKESDKGKNINRINGKIEFKNVSFAYSKDNVLNNISFTINKGERIGFVGSSGSGKSTIFKLLTKLYSLNEGKILIDGEDINNISNKTLRKNISLISQNPYIFNFSILDNLKIGNLDASNDEVIESCKKADIYDVIMNLDDKFNSFVGEGGITLSGGEKQRLAIARTLLTRSNIILFDEATSALDNVTQDKVQKAIYGLDKDKTILIIAHRLSTINKCDRIVVVDDGNIVDIGTHKELYKRCSKYRELYDCEAV